MEGEVTNGIILGVDPGDKGAMVGLNAALRPVIDWTADDRGRADGYFLDGDPDPRRIVGMLTSFKGDIVKVVLETPFAPGRIGTSNAITIGRRWGILYAALLCAGLPVEKVTPAKWSNDMFGGKKGGTEKEKKAVAVRLVQEIIPSLRLVPPGCRVAHDGLADAACLAMWGWRQYRA